ncbi:MAG: hypothetical protein IPG64_21230 [Haliea sp.]|nr:hypothetical protein [Haliea sp.]
MPRTPARAPATLSGTRSMTRCDQSSASCHLPAASAALASSDQSSATVPLAQGFGDRYRGDGADADGGRQRHAQGRSRPSRKVGAAAGQQSPPARQHAQPAGHRHAEAGADEVQQQAGGIGAGEQEQQAARWRAQRQPQGAGAE